MFLAAIYFYLLIYVELTWLYFGSYMRTSSGFWSKISVCSNVSILFYSQIIYSVNESRDLESFVGRFLRIKLNKRC